MHTNSDQQSPTTLKAALLIGFSGLIWACAHFISSPNLDGYGDMLESFAWGQNWNWGGNHKHPPLFGWVAGAWFSIFPTTTLSFKLLALVPIVLGLWGIIFLAYQMKLPHVATAAALLLLWSFPYTTLAAKFNANSQLLAIWPWTAAAFWISLNSHGKRSLLWAIALGILAALSLLTKYYSGIFLLSLFIVAVTQGRGRQWFSSLSPYLALVVLILCLLPHLLWLSTHNYVTLHYIQEQGNGHIDTSNLWRFFLVPIVYWCFAWIAAVIMASNLQTLPEYKNTAKWNRVLRAMWLSWKPIGWNDPLFGFAVLPWSITLLFGVMGLVELSLPWAIPIGYAFSLLWLRNLTIGKDEYLNKLSQQIVSISKLVLVCVLLCGFLLGGVNAYNSNKDYYRPTEEAAIKLKKDWIQANPKVKLGWSTGEWPASALVSFYADNSIVALPSTPETFPSTVTPKVESNPEYFQTTGGLWICPKIKGDNTNPNSCEVLAEKWLSEQNRGIIKREISVKRKGWAFPKATSTLYVSYDILPAK